MTSTFIEPYNVSTAVSMFSVNSALMDFAGKIPNTENTEVTDKEGMRDGKPKWTTLPRITNLKSRITPVYPVVAPISFSLAAARLASSVPG